jgi:MYXO-CTERM domain-containing protein
VRKSKLGVGGGRSEPVIHWVLFLAVMVLVGVPEAGLARSGGITGFSGATAQRDCNACHAARVPIGGELSPDLSLELVEGSLAPGQISRLRLTVVSRFEDAQERAVGFDIASLAQPSRVGALDVVDAEHTRLVDDELTHVRPHPFDDEGVVEVDFEFVPADLGQMVIHVAVLDADMNAHPNPGDKTRTANFCFTLGDTPEFQFDGCTAGLLEPVQPIEPEPPEEPEQPEDPEQPEEPEQPEQPEQPVGPTTPGPDQDEAPESSAPEIIGIDVADEGPQSGCSMVPHQPDAPWTNGLGWMAALCLGGGWLRRRRRRRRFG